MLYKIIPGGGDFLLDSYSCIKKKNATVIFVRWGLTILLILISSKHLSIAFKKLAFKYMLSSFEASTSKMIAFGLCWTDVGLLLVVVTHCSSSISLMGWLLSFSSWKVCLIFSMQKSSKSAQYSLSEFLWEE